MRPFALHAEHEGVRFVWSPDGPSASGPLSRLLSSCPARSLRGQALRGVWDCRRSCAASSPAAGRRRGPLRQPCRDCRTPLHHADGAARRMRSPRRQENRDRAPRDRPPKRGSAPRSAALADGGRAAKDRAADAAAIEDRLGLSAPGAGQQRLERRIPLAQAIAVRCGFGGQSRRCGIRLSRA
jgi:hypothetical protein